MRKDISDGKTREKTSAPRRMERVTEIETGSTGSHSVWRTRFRRGYGLEGNSNDSETSKDNVPLFSEMLAAVNTNPEHPATDHTETGFSSS
jgi:hypothetical protein